MDLKISFDGLPEVKKALELLPKRVGVRAASKAVRAGANVILKSARAKVPVDTGNLKRSLGIKVLNKKRDAIQVTALIGPRVKFRRTNTKAKQAANEKLRNDGFYARFVEYGTKKTAARPFLRPALDESRNAAYQAIADVIGQAIEAEARKLYRRS